MKWFVCGKHVLGRPSASRTYSPPASIPTTAVRSCSGGAGQPGMFTTGFAVLPASTVESGRTPVGFAPAAATPPYAAQVPMAMTRAARGARSFTASSRVMGAPARSPMTQ